MVHLCTSELESTWYGHSAEYFAQTPVFPYELCRPLSHKCGRVYRVASPFNILGWLWLAQLPQPAPQAGPIRRTCPMSFSCYCTFQFRNWWILSWTGSSLLFVLSDSKTLLSPMGLLEICTPAQWQGCWGQLFSCYELADNFSLSEELQWSNEKKKRFGSSDHLPACQVMPWWLISLPSQTLNWFCEAILRSTGYARISCVLALVPQNY